MRRILLFVFLSAFLPGIACQTISHYDPVAYQRGTDLKAESIYLLRKGHESFSSHRKAIEDLELQLLKALEYEKGRYKNEETVKQWRILQNPEGGLLGGTLDMWRSKEKLSKVFLKEQIPQIEAAFDEIIRLEGLKRKRGL